MAARAAARHRAGHEHLQPQAADRPAHGAVPEVPAEGAGRRPGLPGLRRRPARTPAEAVGSAEVVLDRLGVAYFRVVRVATGGAQGAALTQQVPAAVELDRDALQTLAVLGE